MKGNAISFREFGGCELEIIHMKKQKKLEVRIDINIIFWIKFFSYFFKIMIDIVTVREIENSYTKKLLTISHEEVGMFGKFFVGKNFKHHFPIFHYF